MKNKILATLVAFGLVGSASAIEINENLSINGFIDTSWNDLGVKNSNDVQNLGLDEIELNFLFNVGNVSGAIHIDDYDNGAPYAEDGDIDVEQAHFTYGLENGLSFTIGKYGSQLGFEREDPSGLYTYSRAYGNAGVANITGTSNFNLGNVDAYVFEGAAVSYNGELFSLNLSFHNGPDSNLESDDLDTELSFSYTGIENLVLGGGFYFDNQGNSAAATIETDYVNVHAAYQTGKFLIAAEYTEADQDGATNDKLDAYMFLADYAVSDKLAVAFRLSDNEVSATQNYDKMTIAPRYAITDSLGAVVEYSDIEVGAVDANLLAVELTYTF
ncbi:hypothetical protein OAQ34_06650 [Opitutales bacterium]|nr:hypothetical protein [Opitutales bacterium]